MKRRLVLCLCLLGCLLAALPALAQEGPRGNQLLLIMDDSLLLWDAGRGEAESLPNIDFSEVSPWAYGWAWSPDGRYLLAPASFSTPRATRLYDVDAQTWDARTFGESAAWSPDGKSILHVHPIENGAELLLYDWASGENTTLYRVQRDDWPEGISQPVWSPNSQSAFFVSYSASLGGSTNAANLLNLESGQVYFLHGGWYVSFDPIWSPDGKFFLLRLEETGPDVRGSTMINDAEVGDIYLFDAHTGARQRITYTPLRAESNIRWAADGQTILYDVIETKAVTLADAYTPPPAMEDVVIPAIPRVKYAGATTVIGTSPDGSLQLWNTSTCDLIISDAAGNGVGGIHSSATPTAGGCPRHEIIGWRPLPPS